jgi:hypothetical protein
VRLPAWRAEYFDNAKDEVPSRIEIIEAEYEADALVEARSKMPSNCSRKLSPSLFYIISFLTWWVPRPLVILMPILA